MHIWLFMGTVIVASAVEMVETMTILLASGLTRGWRSTIEGALAAVLVLAAIVAVLGPALVTLVPVDILRLVVGSVLLIYGSQWLRKAILRASAYKALHDEAAIYQREVKELSATAGRQGGRDPIAFTVSFKGVLLEGLEVVIIVISFGAQEDRLGLAALGALGGAALVAAVGVAIAKPLARVPENTMKMGVGLMLTTFGTFWLGEGVGIEWPTGDLYIFILLGFFTISCLGLIRLLRSRQPAAARVGV